MRAKAKGYRLKVTADKVTLIKPTPLTEPPEAA
jgi:hypothetical protein